MDNQIFANESLVYAGTVLIGLLIFAFILFAFFSVVALATVVRGVMLLVSPVTKLVRTALGNEESRPAANQANDAQLTDELLADGLPDQTAKPGPLLPPAVRETLGHGLSAARSHAGSAASGLATHAGRAAKASKTAVAAKWAAHRSADDESKAA